MDSDVEKAADVEPKPGPPKGKKMSFKQKIQAAKEEKDNNKIGLICMGTIGCQVITILFILLCVAMIYFGATNINNCTITSFIPIYLLVQGVCAILDQLLLRKYNIFKITNCCQSCDKEDEPRSNMKKWLGRIFHAFLFVWFIVGSVFVYKIYKPNYNPALGEYCDQTTYLFAFWSISIIYVFAVFLLFREWRVPKYFKK